MAEQVLAPPAPNQVLDVVNIAPAPAVPASGLPVPEPVLAVPVAQVENPLPVAANNREFKIRRLRTTATDKYATAHDQNHVTVHSSRVVLRLR